MDSDFSYSQNTQTQTQPQTQGTQQHSQLDSSAGFPSHLWGKLFPTSSSPSGATLSPNGAHQINHHSLGRVDVVELPWSKLELTVGRGPSCGLRLTHGKVSTKHAKLWYDVEDNNVKLMDTSTNGTFFDTARAGRAPHITIRKEHPRWLMLAHSGQGCDSRPVGKDSVTVIENGDIIVFGPANPDFVDEYRFMFRGPIQPGHVHRSDKPWPVDESKEPNIYRSYEIREQLGKGSFAIVWKGVQRATGRTVAIKVIEKARFMSNEKTMLMIAREVEIMKGLRHKYCVRYYDHFEDEHRIWIVLEYVDGGDLLEYVMKHPGGLACLDGTLLAGVKETREIALMVCEAVAYLHSQGVAHRDLKPENLLMSKGVIPVCKVTDFGLAKMVDEGTMLRTMCGTPTYLAPEVVLGNDPGSGYGSAVDAWSIGVILYSCLTCQTPFDDSEATPLPDRMKHRIVDWSWLVEDRAIDPLAIDFLSKLLVQDPKQRMTVQAALQHPWLRTVSTHSSPQLDVPRDSTQQTRIDSNGTSVASSAALEESYASMGVCRNMSDSFIDSQGMNNLRINGTRTSTPQRPTTATAHGVEHDAPQLNGDEDTTIAPTEIGDRSVDSTDANFETTIALKVNSKRTTIVPRAPTFFPPSIPSKRKVLQSAWSSSEDEKSGGGGSSVMSIDAPSRTEHPSKLQGDIAPPLMPSLHLPGVRELNEVELGHDATGVASSDAGEEHPVEDEADASNHKSSTRRTTRRSARRGSASIATTTTATTPNRKSKAANGNSGARRSAGRAANRASVEPSSADANIEGAVTRQRAAKMAKVA
ncbi:BZ3500_MvSof-1268-A1-R1_Chr7-1g09392 [Microbotryum saponariae]|uniref:BZ3500_MvSof-1268-A1-R1_Chr7-1g09392 protein n=1 Tax=Microbotryum saponariae TaxID=289078 RepID=A0A2X0L2N6_9BASI|nr:BZ3501_MvSof-1269-A2-R1_Chr7-1g09097 [Microbotryum saponariae]SDA03351.1 BZ3500_MvSof-1268-A1-R1_Chr7-1g09392 [Microbotryum saponariae]